MILFQIFPGGFLPSLTQIVGAINTGAQQSLIIDRIENLGGYGRALSEWTDTFKVNFDFLIRPEVMKITPKISDAEIEAFRRKWLVIMRLHTTTWSSMLTLTSTTLRTAKLGLMHKSSAA
jgi:hypothetical protein